MAKLKFIFSILIASFLIVACTKEGPTKIVKVATEPIQATNPTGGDAGGGVTMGSTTQEVELAIKEAIFLFKNYKFTDMNNLFDALRDVIDHRDEVDSKLIAEIQNKGDFLENFKKSKVSLNMSDCPGVKGHKHAAVSSHSLGANICFNVEALKELPPSSLSRALVALIAHEYVHLLGFREPEAVRTQKMVVKSWPKFEMYQYIYFQTHLVNAYRDILNTLNKVALFASENNFEMANASAKSLESQRMAFQNLHQNHAMSWLVRVNDKEKMLETGSEIFSLDFNIVSSGSDANDSWIETQARTKKLFCELAELYFPYRDSVFTIDEADALLDLGEEVTSKKQIKIEASRIAIKCDNVSDENFDNSEYLEYEASK